MDNKKDPLQKDEKRFSDDYKDGPSPPQRLRITAVHPVTRRQVAKDFSLKKYSIEEATKLAREWKASILAIKPEDSSSPPPPMTNVPQIFKTRHIDSVQLPKNDYGMSWLLLGSTRSGKSTLMNYLYENIFRAHICVLHTASIQSDIYKPLQKSCAIAPMFIPELIDETAKINKETKNHYQFCHIIDDIVDKRNSKSLLKLLTIYRNSRLSTMITGQELSIFNAIGRSNINFVVLMKLNSAMAIEKVIKTYLRPYFPPGTRLDEMIRIYQQLTSDHAFIVIDNINGDIFMSKLTEAEIKH
jgi:hypothetical protein